MELPKKNEPRSAGIALAVLPLAGAIIGGLNGQPTIGLLAGFGAGAAIVLAVWLLDRG